MMRSQLSKKYPTKFFKKLFKRTKSLKNKRLRRKLSLLNLKLMIKYAKLSKKQLKR